MGELVDKLLQMAEELSASGEEDLARECRETATRILDHLCYITQTGGVR